MRATKPTTIQNGNMSSTAGELYTQPARPKRRTKARPLNFREGMRRLGIMVSAVGSIFGAVYGYLLVVDTRALSANGFRQDSVMVNYAIASLLPVLGFWAPWEIIHFLVWIGSAFSEQPTVRKQRHTRLPAGPAKRRGYARG